MSQLLNNVGYAVVGLPVVGDLDGLPVDGLAVGKRVGDLDGLPVVGLPVGYAVDGLAVEGGLDGLPVDGL